MSLETSVAVLVASPSQCSISEALWNDSAWSCVVTRRVIEFQVTGSAIPSMIPSRASDSPTRTANCRRRNEFLPT